MRFGLFGGARTKRVTASEGGLADCQGHETFIQETERLDYQSLFTVEHRSTGRGQVSASSTLLARLVAKMSCIRLGAAVVVMPWHDPVPIAEQTTTLDLVSGGREVGGVETILLVDPNASTASPRALAAKAMPAFRPAQAVAAA